MSTDPYPEVSVDESGIVPPQGARPAEWPKKLRTLTGNNTYSGATTINNGGITVTGASLASPSLTLAGATFTANNAAASLSFGSGTTLNSGSTLNINAAGTSSTNSAIGTGTLTINGGTIDNTSVGAITLATNNAQTWNSDFTFTGTQTLNLGTGAVSLGTAASTSRTITVNANTLTIGGVISNGTTANSLIKAGAGTLSFDHSGKNAFFARLEFQGP